MAENVLLDVLWAITLFFLNPLLATALIASIILGYFRVRRERRSFKVRLLPGLTEFKRILSESWLHALILSILISGIGLLVDPGWLVLFCGFSFVGLLSFYYKIASPIYFAAAAFSTIYLMERYADTFSYRGWLSGASFPFTAISVSYVTTGTPGNVNKAASANFHLAGGNILSSTILWVKRGPVNSSN